MPVEDRRLTPDPHPVGRLWSQYSELAWVLLAAAVGLSVPDVGRTLARHDAINIVLTILVFAAALTVPVQIGARLREHGLRLLLVTALSSVAVVALAWAGSRFVDAGPLRFGVLAVGLASAEIATLGIAPRGGGDSLSSGVMLIGSTLLTALFAGPVVALLASGSDVHVGNLVVTLVVVVVVPFGLGLAIRSRIGARARAAAGTVALAAVTVLVWLVASQARLSQAYVAVVVALAVLIGASAVVGFGLGRILEPAAGRSLVFATSMRDFAVASGIASAAFGARAAAPLGLYGIMVMVWGTALAGTLGRKPGTGP